MVSLELNQDGDVEGKFDKITGEFRCKDLESQLRALSDDDLKRFYSLTDVNTERIVEEVTGRRVERFA